MTVSRLGKLICEVGGVGSLAEAERLRSQPVTIEIGNGEEAKIGMLSRLAVALALRTQRGAVRVRANPSSHGASLRGAQSLVAGLRDEAARYGQVSRVEFIEAHSSGPGVRLLIGDQSDARMSSADAAGWVAAVNRKLPATAEAEAAACAFAVACAYAKQFGAAVLGNADSSAESWALDLLSLEADPVVPLEYRAASMDIGRVGLLGAGAIGSAFAYILRLSGWAAGLDILDRGDYEEPNEETTCLVGRSEVLHRLPKASTLAAAARTDVLKAVGIKADIVGTSEELKVARALFVCAVDNMETRRALDDLAAPVVINAAVGGSRLDAGHVLVSRHAPGDPRLSSLYKEQHATQVAATTNAAPSEITDACSRIAYEGVSLAAPFIATAAAALAVAECGRRAIGLKYGPNYTKCDLFGIQRFMQVNRR